MGVKNIIKGTIQVNGHSLKLHFCIFEKSQVKHNSLDCHYFFGIFFINCKFYMLKVEHKSKMFLHVHHIQTSRVDGHWVFEKVIFSYLMCTILF